MVSRIEPHLTVADLDAFPEDDGNRYELIDGELFVSDAPGISHQRLSIDDEITSPLLPDFQLKVSTICSF